MPHPEHDPGAPGAPHVDEGTIHAWLDDALPADERSAVEAHVAVCAVCAAAVAEARGLVAGASRILSALDGGLGAVSAAPRAGAATPIAAGRVGRPSPRRWWATTNARAAAALLIVAGGSGILLTTAGPRLAGRQVADSTAAEESVAELRVDSQLAMPQSKSALRTAVAFDAWHDSVAGSEERRARGTATAGSQADAAGRPTAVPSAPAAPPVQPSTALAAAVPPAAPVAAATMSRGVAGGVARPMVGAARVEAQVLRGVVREAGTQQPVAGATVSIAGAGAAAAAVTDSGGRFTLRDVPAGMHLAQARRAGYAADTLSLAVVPGRAAELRVELRKATEAVGAQRERSAAAPAAARAVAPVRAFASGASNAPPREVAGCYWMAAPSAPAGALPGLVRLDTTVAADGGFTARLAGPAGSRWPPGRWTVAGGPANALATVTVSWVTTLGRTQLDLTRAGRDLAGTARLPGDAEGATPHGVRLVRTACAPGTPQP
jgi:hypothetical protein